MCDFKKFSKSNDMVFDVGTILNLCNDWKAPLYSIEESDTYLTIYKQITNYVDTICADFWEWKGLLFVF